MKQATRAWLSRSRARARRELEPVRRRVQGVLTGDQLGSALRLAGIGPGVTVMTHVSMNDLRRTAPSVDAMSLIAMLKELVTPGGTLLVLTSPFSGLEADYVARNPSFDVRRTPSRMGLMTELFRRMPDTIRSLHPTHPVAGWGARAAELLATHHEGETFGESSPFCLMRSYGGLVVGIGAGVRNGFSIIHCAEYLHAAAREHAFATERCSLMINDGERSFGYTFRPLRGGLDRDIRGIERRLRATKAVSYERHSGLLISSASTETFISRATDLISAGSFYRYPLPATATP